VRTLAAIALFVVSSILYAQTANITALGPEGGIITLLKVRPDDAVVFAVINEDKLYRSLNGGEWWEKVYLPEPYIPENTGGSQLQSRLSINDIAFHPLSDTVLLATSMGLFRSTDLGSSWLQVYASPSPKLCIKYVPANPSIIFGSDEQGILISTNGGDTWEYRTDNVIGNRYIRRFAVHPADANIQNIRLLATTDYNDTTAVYFTSNGGAAWRLYNSGLPAGAARKIFDVQMDATGLGVSNFRAALTTANGIYVLQTDISSSWVQVPKVAGIITGGMFVADTIGGIPGINIYIASNGSEFNRTLGVYSAANGLIKIDTREGSLLNPAPRRMFTELSAISSISIPVKSNSGKIYLGTSAGIFISTDGGTAWSSKNSGVYHREIRNLASHNGELFAGVYGAGVYRLSDYGEQWVPSNGGLTNPYVTTVISDGRRLYAGTVYTVYFSDDNGRSWTAVSPTKFPIAADSSNLHDVEMSIRVSPKNSNFVLMRSNVYGLNLSKDAGQNWAKVTLPAGYDTIHIPENIEFDPVDSLTIYYSGSGLLKSTNLGASWSDISSNIPRSLFVPSQNGNVNIQTLSPTINPKNNREIFLASVYDMSEGEPLGLWKTTNGGDTAWTMVNPPLKVYDVQYDKYDSKRLLASGPAGIFRTTNGGSSWDSLWEQQGANIRYYLLSPHFSDPNIFFVGSEQGAFKIELNEASDLTVDSLVHDFGNVPVGRENIRFVALQNKNGQRDVWVQYTGLSDTSSFRYIGPKEIVVPAGGEASFEIAFKPDSIGFHIALLRFSTTDPNYDSLYFVLYGMGTSRKFMYDFGSVTVGSDTALKIEIDNQSSLTPLSISNITISDTLSFSVVGRRDMVVAAGGIDSFAVRFAPKSTGAKQAYVRVITSGVGGSDIVYRLQGTGIARSFISRRVLLADVGFYSYDGSSLNEYYKFFAQSLERANIKVDYKKLEEVDIPFSEYSAIVFVLPYGPPPQEVIDSLASYILNGGTAVAVGDFGERNVLPFNTVLSDSVWKKYNLKTGIRFNTDLLIDAGITDASLQGMSIAYPVLRNALTYKVDSVVLFTSGSLSIDTTVRNAMPLLAAKSPSLVSINPFDSASTPLFGKEKIVAAYSLVGKGKIIAIADYDIWWNGFPEDTTKPFGIFGGNNLRFALNIFGLVDNLAAQLPNRTPQESFKLFSIPYSFADSSVRELFKDLGEHSIYTWRLFGKWRDSIGYAEFPKDFVNIRRGEGYWLTTREPKEINFGTATAQGSESDFEITLQPGYNMIGNPFPYRVNWASSFREDSVENVLWKYDENFDTTSLFMEPFEGYFVKNRGSLPKKIRISSAEAASATTSLSKGKGDANLYAPLEWKLQLIVQSSNAIDSRNYIGMLNNATDGIDDADFSEPPSAPSNYVSLSLKTNKERLAADYRSISENGQSWDVIIESSKPNVPVTISLNKFGNFPSNFKVYLLDKISERVIDVGTSLSYSFSLNKKEYNRQLRVIVGTQNFVENNSGGIPLVPLVYSLEQNFPNPFNPRTSIRYTLSHSANVKLEIFNILGQKIKTLVTQFQPIGVYTIQWDGTDDQQKKVASGFYYYRLQANEFTRVKKMTLIK